MSNREDLLTPVGRLVQGSIYEGQSTDAENRPLVYKTGPNAGQPRQEFYFALAIPKGSEKHWAETEWGKKIWNVGHASFPNGAANSPTFAWKIKDGDSQIPNRAGRKPCDCEGFPGHWVLSFSSGYAPAVYNSTGTQQVLEPNAVNLGDYVQVYGSVAGNDAAQQPGVYLNHSMVAIAGYGKRIFIGADPKAVGFGNSPLPPGASATPLAQGFNPAPAALPPVTTPTPAPAPLPAHPSAAAPVTLPAVNNAPAPNYGILTPPAPIAPVARVMLPAAQGATYEQMIAAGWTDALLVQHGMMQA